MHNPLSVPPSKSAIQRRLEEFLRIPVPRTKEEKAAKQEERAARQKERTEEDSRKRAKRITLRPPSPPTVFLFNWRKYVWADSTKTRRYH